jgi:murein DD-endopeptidase MepM/ murein hydrolase activator NlpD
VSLCGFLTVGLTLGLTPLTSADTGSDKKKLDADIAAVRTALEGTSQDLAQAFVELQRTKAELPGAQRALAAADAAQGVADRRNQAMATALAVAEANAAKAKDALSRNARESQKVQDQLGNLVREDYQQGGVSGLSIALEASSPEDFTDRIILMDTVMRIRGAKLRELGSMRAQGKADQAHLVAVGHQVTVLKAETEAALAQAMAARKTAAAAKSRLDRLIAAQTRYEATVAAKKAAEIARINAMQAQSDALTRLLAARARAAREAAARSARQPAPLSAPGGSGGRFLSYPATAPVSSEFGMRFHPVLRFWRLHNGIDFAAPCGSPIYAAAAGEVILTSPVGQSGGYGNRLIIDHGLHGGVDLTTTYNHLTRFVVTSGRVARGQLVAYSGTTGLSTGCHLHFETREDGNPVNPRLWF